MDRCFILHPKTASSSQAWKHPTAGDVVRFSFKTIERWYYLAKSDDDPMRSLERKVPKHAGTHPAISPALGEAILKGGVQGRVVVDVNA